MTHTAVAWLLTEGVLLHPCPGVSPTKGGQKKPGLLFCGVSRAFALVSALCLPEEEKPAQPPQETSPRHSN